MDKRTHDKLKAEIATVDSLRARISVLEDFQEELNNQIADLMDERDELERKNQQIEATTHMIRDSYSNMMDSLSEQNGFLTGQVQKYQGLIQKKEEQAVKLTKILSRYKERNAELLQELMSLKATRRKEFLKRGDRKLFMFLAVSGWVVALIMVLSK